MILNALSGQIVRWWRIEIVPPSSPDHQMSIGDAGIKLKFIVIYVIFFPMNLVRSFNFKKLFSAFMQNPFKIFK